MSDYFERVETHLLDAVEREAQLRGGHFGGAPRRLPVAPRRLRQAPGAPRRLQHAPRRLLRPPRHHRRGLLLIAVVLLLGGSAAAAVLIAGEPSRSLSGVVPPYDASGNISLGGGHYEITITPALKAGTIGWCTSIHYRDVPSLRAEGGEFGGGGCGAGTPAVGSPLFAPDGSQERGLWYVLAAPQVAAVRVANGPTVLTRADARLPRGFRAAVFEIPAKAFAHGFPRLTALDASGRAIPGSFYESPPKEPARYWQYPQRQPQGRCPLTARRGSGVHAGLGEVLTAIVPDPGIIGHAYLSCTEVGFRFHATWLTAAVLLDAKHPGALPAVLPDMRPVPGAPGVFDRSSASLPEGIAARRVGNAWLVVKGQAGVGQRVQALRALRVGAIDLRAPSRMASASASAPCSILVRPLAGLREVAQSAPSRSRLAQFLALPAPRGAVELAPCANAGFYYRDWPLQATVLLVAGGHGPLRGLLDKQAVPGHPGVFTVRSEEEGTLETVRRIGAAWLEVKGGSGTAQQRIVLERLAARTPARGARMPARTARPPTRGGGQNR